MIFASLGCTSSSGRTLSNPNLVIRSLLPASAVVNKINNNSDENHTVYPNPFQSTLFLDQNFDISPLTIEIFDIEGRLVLKQTKGTSQKPISIDAAQLKNGTYQLLVKDAGKVLLFQKVVKK
ncbi:T9SS type A sorting domain-containing protein [Reichenbachiella versicolor]|uniref:T9SS type A sorting domain-containing protein n=1 Tax=Reichenbachiella versicolor TaxID=1821036 RepID=UPI0013A52CCD|nr:T9SS type A sorting domain-containing protein [Reichenbachiella versicolor]